MQLDTALSSNMPSVAAQGDAEVRPPRREWQAPVGQVIDIAEVTRSGIGPNSDGGGCAS